MKCFVYRIVKQYKLTKDEWDQRITELWVRHGDMMRYKIVLKFGSMICVEFGVVNFNGVKI